MSLRQAKIQGLLQSACGWRFATVLRGADREGPAGGTQLSAGGRPDAEGRRYAARAYNAQGRGARPSRSSRAGSLAVETLRTRACCTWRGSEQAFQVYPLKTCDASQARQGRLKTRVPTARPTCRLSPQEAGASKFCLLRLL